MEHATYLFFTTQCSEALAFYTECDLGKVVLMNRAPSGSVMHSRFEGPCVRFYASDNLDAEPMRGFAQFLVFTDRAELDRVFELLAVNGTVTTPLGIQPWGDYFGKLTDQFGVQWMMNCASPR